MGLPPSILHQENIAKCLSPEQRKKAGVQTAAEAADKQRVKSERDLQQDIEQFLRMRGVNWIIRNRMDKRPTVKRGQADICFVHHGIPFALEAKLPGQKPTTEQEQAGICMLKDGWRWHVVTSLDDVKRLLDSV